MSNTPVLTVSQDKQGISHRFQTWIKSLDISLGSKVLGPDKTISGKAQETINSATQQARTVDEQKGISKTAHDVNIFPSYIVVA
jgi:hypothetical protein